MTPLEAIASFRGRWSHAPLDRRDVEERVALRFEGGGPEVRVLEARGACRVFVRAGELEADDLPEGEESKGSALGRWLSRYVHDVRSVDVVLSWIEARVVELAREREERARARAERARAKAEREARCSA
jgi:hypothetical protein